MRRLVLLAATLPLLVPAAADARKRVLGSSLKARATLVEAHKVDTVFWPRAIPGRSFRMPADGQVLAIRLKGSVLRSSAAGAPDPLNEVHFQSLRPARHGAMRVLLTSQPFRVPIGGSSNRITTYRPQNLCVRKGGVVAFNDEGGFMAPWYPNGAPFQVFGRVANARTARYTAAGGTNNGATLRPTVRRGSELLMQVVVGTGADLGGACRGFLAGH